MAKIRIDKSRCKMCGACVDICPEGLFIQEKLKTVPRVPRQKGCISCGHCVSICPNGAVFHVDFPDLNPGLLP